MTPRRAAAVVLCALAWSASGCARREAPVVGEAPQEPSPSAAFKWVPVKPASAAAPEEYPARVLVTPGAAAVLVPPLPARVLGVLVKPGDSVAKDGAIARVVMPDADAAVAMVSAADSGLATLSKRRAKLGVLEAEGLAKGSELATLDLELARLQGEKLRGEAVLRGAALSGGGTIVLRSPVAGVVTEVLAIQGELRRPEDGPIARIRSRSGHRIESLLPNSPSPDAVFTFQGGSGPPVAVTFVAVVPKTGGAGYQAWFDASESAPLPAISEGRLVIQGDASAGGRLVPASAVGYRGTERFLVVRDRAGGRESVVRVDVVRIASTDAIVRGELPDGVLVASDPYRAQASAGAEKRP